MYCGCSWELFAGLVVSRSVWVLVVRSDSSVCNYVSHSLFRPSSVAAVGSELSAAVYEFLFGQSGHVCSEEPVVGFYATSCGKGPAWSALALVLNCTYCTIKYPVNIFFVNTTALFIVLFDTERRMERSSVHQYKLFVFLLGYVAQVVHGVVVVVLV